MPLLLGLGRTDLDVAGCSLLHRLVNSDVVWVNTVPSQCHDLLRSQAALDTKHNEYVVEVLERQNPVDLPHLIKAPDILLTLAPGSRPRFQPPEVEPRALAHVGAPVEERTERTLVVDVLCAGLREGPLQLGQSDVFQPPVP